MSNNVPKHALPLVMDTVEQEAAHYAHAMAHDLVDDVEQRIADAYRAGHHDGRRAAHEDQSF